jgi:hypothetical protein
VFVGPQIVYPELRCPRFLGGWFAVEEEDVGLDSLRVDLKSPGAKNETGGPRGRRAGKRGVNMPVGRRSKVCTLACLSNSRLTVCLHQGYASSSHFVLKWASAQAFTGVAFEEDNGDRGSGRHGREARRGEQLGRCESLSGTTIPARPCCFRMVKTC